MLPIGEEKFSASPFDISPKSKDELPMGFFPPESAPPGIHPVYGRRWLWSKPGHLEVEMRREKWRRAYKVYGWRPETVYAYRDAPGEPREYVAATTGALVDKVTTDPTRAKPVPTSYTFLLKKTGWTLTPEVLSADTPPGYFHPATAAYGVMYYALWEPSPGNFTRGVALKTDDSTWVDDELCPCDTPCGYLSSTVYAYRDVPGVGREYVTEVTSGGPVVGSFEREGAKRIDVYYASDLVKAGWSLTPGHLPKT